MTAARFQHGFDFTRICNNDIGEGRAGFAMSADALPRLLPALWGSTGDNLTGLVWRVVEYGMRSTVNIARKRAAAIEGESCCGREACRLPSVHRLQSVRNSACGQRDDDRIAAPLTASLRSDLEGHPGGVWTVSWVPSTGAGDAFVINFTTGEIVMTPELQTLLRGRLAHSAR